MTATLTRVSTGTSADMVSRILSTLLPDARTVLDMTYGSGKFWDGSQRVAVTGLDLDPDRARHVCADFTRLPFADASYDVAIFDPPYIAEAGKGSAIGRRFGSYPSLDAMRASVTAGTSEAWRVSRIGIVVKVMDYIHTSRLVRMTRWVEDAIPADLYDIVHLASTSKIEDPKWSRVGAQLSARSNATTWLIWRHDGATHRRRRQSDQSSLVS